MRVSSARAVSTVDTHVRLYGIDLHVNIDDDDDDDDDVLFDSNLAALESAIASVADAQNKKNVDPVTSALHGLLEKRNILQHYAIVDYRKQRSAQRDIEQKVIAQSAALLGGAAGKKKGSVRSFAIPLTESNLANFQLNSAADAQSGGAQPVYNKLNLSRLGSRTAADSTNVLAKKKDSKSQSKLYVQVDNLKTDGISRVNAALKATVALRKEGPIEAVSPSLWDVAIDSLDGSSVDGQPIEIVKPLRSASILVSIECTTLYIVCKR
jgi:hypothetical protein